MVLGPGLGLGLGLVDTIKGARGHGDMGTRGETGLKGRPEIGKDAVAAFSGLGSRPSGIWFRCSGSGAGPGTDT